MTCGACRSLPTSVLCVTSHTASVALRTLSISLQPSTVFPQKTHFCHLALHFLIVLFLYNTYPCFLFVFVYPPPHPHISLMKEPCTDLHLLLVLHPLLSFIVSVSQRQEGVVPVPLFRLEALLLHGFADPGPVAVVAEGSEELLPGDLEGHGRHLGLSVGGQAEEVGAAVLLAQIAEQTEQVGLGHPGHGLFVPRGKTFEDSLVKT